MKKKSIIILVTSVILLVVAVFLLKNYHENRIESQIQKIGGKALTYQTLDISLLQRQVVLEEVEYQKEGKIVKIPKVVFEGIQFLDYISGNELTINHVRVKKPKIMIHKENDSVQEPSKDQKTSEFSKNITIKEFEAVNGQFQIKKQDSTKLFISFPEFRLSGVEIDSSTVNEKIPFVYKNYHFEGDSVVIKLGKFHNMVAKEVLLDTSRAVVSHLRIIPNEDKIDFQKQLEYEKDRISLTLDSIAITSPDLEFINDSLHFSSPKTLISGVDFHIYRDKSLPDSPKKKLLYQALLRKSPVKLKLEQIEIRKSQLVYEEKVVANEPAAKIGFYGIGGEIKDLTNFNLNRENFPETKIDLSASFLNVAPLDMEWSFNVGTLAKKFSISGSFGTVPADAINRYLKLSMNKAARGKIKSLSFNFSGNEDVATGDVRVEYDRFKIIILGEDGEEKQGFLTTLANLFVDNDGYSGSYVVEDVTITRDKTKSFWNYIWSGIRKGLLEAVKQL